MVIGAIRLDLGSGNYFRSLSCVHAEVIAGRPRVYLLCNAVRGTALLILDWLLRVRVVLWYAVGRL